MMENNIMVSICCITYNHEKFIRRAVESFLNQKTDFNYEIIIHDDASIDNTAKIIREYKEKYGDIIIPIFQKENQYSKCKLVSDEFVYPKARGKYIAICEGDDYWEDEFKLQKQIDYMEKNEECTFCFTNGWIEDAITGDRRPFIPYSDADKQYYIGESQTYTLDEIYKVSFAPTASYVFRKSVYNKLPKSYFQAVPTGDLKMRLFFTACGYSYFLDEKTCVYSENVPDSMMTKWKKEKRDLTFNRSKKIVDMINNVNQFTNKKYENGLNKIKDIHVRGMLNNVNGFKILKNSDCKRVYRQCSFLEKSEIIIKMIVPNFIIDKIKNSIRENRK